MPSLVQNIQSLPVEIFEEGILPYLSGESIRTMASTCKDLRQIIRPYEFHLFWISDNDTFRSLYTNRLENEQPSFWWRTRTIILWCQLDTQNCQALTRIVRQCTNLLQIIDFRLYATLMPDECQPWPKVKKAYRKLQRSLPKQAVYLHWNIWYASGELNLGARWNVNRTGDHFSIGYQQLMLEYDGLGGYYGYENVPEKVFEMIYNGPAIYGQAPFIPRSRYHYLNRDKSEGFNHMLQHIHQAFIHGQIRQVILPPWPALFQSVKLLPFLFATRATPKKDDRLFSKRELVNIFPAILAIQYLFKWLTDGPQSIDQVAVWIQRSNELNFINELPSIDQLVRHKVIDWNCLICQPALPDPFMNQITKKATYFAKAHLHKLIKMSNTDKPFYQAVKRVILSPDIYSDTGFAIEVEAVSKNSSRRPV